MAPIQKAAPMAATNRMQAMEPAAPLVLGGRELDEVQVGSCAIVASQGRFLPRVVRATHPVQG